jgi:hypothetical protein
MRTGNGPLGGERCKPAQLPARSSPPTTDSHSGPHKPGRADACPTVRSLVACCQFAAGAGLLALDWGGRSSQRDIVLYEAARSTLQRSAARQMAVFGITQVTVHVPFKSNEVPFRYLRRSLLISPGHGAASGMALPGASLMPGTARLWP